MLDKLDFDIIKEMRHNARIPYLEMAKKLDASESTVRHIV